MLKALQWINAGALVGAHRDGGKTPEKFSQKIWSFFIWRTNK